MKMATVLRQNAAKVNIREMTYRVNDRRVALLRDRLAQGLSVEQHFRVEWELATELLNDGQNAECLKTVDDIEGYSSDPGSRSTPRSAGIPNAAGAGIPPLR